MADPEFDDLMGLDLSSLELDHIELDDDRPPNPAWRWVALVILLGMGALLLWLPTSQFYQSSPAANWLFATICVVAVINGIFLGRWLWRWAEDAAERWARKRPNRPPRTRKPPGPLQRWLTLIVALGGAGALLFVVTPSQLSGGGSAGYSELWYLASFGAVAVGILLGRWLLMQESNPFKRTGPVKPIKFPPWFKWVTLTVIIGGSVVVMLGLQIFGGAEDREAVEFALGGGAFCIGIVFAIWVARRFDETEAKIRKQVRGRRAPGAVVRTPPLGGGDRFQRR